MTHRQTWLATPAQRVFYSYSENTNDKQLLTATKLTPARDSATFAWAWRRGERRAIAAATPVALCLCPYG